MLNRHRVSPSPSPLPLPLSVSPISQGKGRACDRCRRRKSRCDFTETATDARCTNCRVGGQSCTFHLPLAKRGPKAPHSHVRVQNHGHGHTHGHNQNQNHGGSPDRHRGDRPSASPPTSTLPVTVTTSPIAAVAAADSLMFIDGDGLNQSQSQNSNQTQGQPQIQPQIQNQNNGGGLGPDLTITSLTNITNITNPTSLTDLLSSTIGWEPSAVESGYASAQTQTQTASLPAPTHPSQPTAPPAPLSPVLIRTAHTQQRWRDLSQTLMARYNANPGTSPSASVSISARDIATRCILLFFEYLYALTPLVHKPTLHKALAFLEGDDVRPDENSDETMHLHPDEAFALVTAVCAEAAFFLPATVFPEGAAVADVFLEASRNCLSASSYLETDLDAPNANSIVIRYFHSNCLHATGRPKYSWHIFGEATRLIQAMGLHDVRLLAWLPPLEAEMRRRAFWIVYMGDKSAAILNGRPITIHRFSFDSHITLPYPTGMGGGGNDGGGGGDGDDCIVGFNANLELWQVASQLLLEIRVQKEKEEKEGKQQQSSPISTPTSIPTPTPTPSSLVEQRNYFHSLYIGFMTELDQLPPYLQPAGFTCTSNQTSSPTSKAFVSQCVNLHVSFYCLRVVILQNLRQLACFGDDGYEIEPADLRTTEIVRDTLRLLNDAPFWALQVNGEPLVEKLRLLGGSLLAIIHRHEQEDSSRNTDNPSPLARRARADFSILLNILSRLDSKASDALRTKSSSQMVV